MLLVVVDCVCMCLWRWGEYDVVSLFFFLDIFCVWVRRAATRRCVVRVCVSVCVRPMIRHCTQKKDTQGGRG